MVNNYRFVLIKMRTILFIDMVRKIKSSWNILKKKIYQVLICLNILNIRGGGTQNSAMDLTYLAFTNNGIKYVIYDTYFSEVDKLEAGIKVKESETNSTDLKGLTKSRKGKLSDLKDKVKEGEELYD